MPYGHTAVGAQLVIWAIYAGPDAAANDALRRGAVNLNVVLMGMGEPLYNYEAVKSLSDLDGWGGLIPLKTPFQLGVVPELKH